MLPAQAACNVMTFQFDPTSGVVLSPSTLTVANGACVTFHNATITQAQFSVGHYKSNAPAFSDATPNYVAGPAGTHQTVTASGAAGNARGTIVVKPAPPKPSPSPTHSSSPTPRHTSTPARQPSSSPPPAPPTPPATTPTAAPPPVQPLVSPPAGSTPYLAGQPTPTPSPTSSAAVVAGPLQPPTDRGTGLPAALAALAVVGVAGALLRVLLAEPLGPVDSNSRTVGMAS